MAAPTRPRSHRPALARLPGRPGDDALRRDSNLAGATAKATTVAPRPDASDASGAPDGLHERIGGLVDRAVAAGDELAAQCARGALVVVEFLDHGLYPAPGRNPRNEVMADNLRRLFATDPQARILVSAHNVHLQRSPSFDGTTPIGALLDDELAADMVLIGTTRGSVAVPTIDPTADPGRRYTMPTDTPEPAPSHTLDALLDTAGPLHLTDLRGLDRQLLDGITSMQGAYGLNVDLAPSTPSTPSSTPAPSPRPTAPTTDRASRGALPSDRDQLHHHPGPGPGG